MNRLNELTALAAFLVAIFYAVTKECFGLFISIQIINGIITIINYIRVFGFDCTE